MKKLSYKHTISASCIGYISQAIINNFAPLLFLIFRDSLGIPLSKITLLITINFCVQLFVDLISAKIVDFFGYKPSIVTAHIMAAAGLVLMAVLPGITDPFAGLVTAVIINAVGGGIIEVLISPIVEACPTDNKSAFMNILHSFYCWGCVLVIAVSTVFLHFAGKDQWRLLSVLWAIVPALNAVYFTQVPIAPLTEDGKGMGVRELAKNKTFWVFILLMITAGASELSMSQWASALAEAGLGISKTSGDLAGPCMFAVLMGTARLINAKICGKIGLYPVMIFSGALCILSYLTVSLAESPIVSVIGCAVCGFSVGVMWPSAFSMASSKFAKGGTVMFALLALAGDLGATAGPTLVGEIAGSSSDNLKGAMLVAIVFPILLIICCVILHEKKKKIN